MAIYYCKVTNISRGGGRSAVGAAAYRANEKIKNEYDGRFHNYTNKHDVAYKEIIAPENAPWWVQSRKKLWNEVEKIEKASNSRLAREITVALPNELTRDEQIELSREYCREVLANQGMIADLCIHDKGDGNPHAHIMMTTRGFDEQGKWQPKARKEYILDKNGERIKLKSGEWKSRKIDMNDWNTTERLEIMREQWAVVANRYLPKEYHIDHRSYEDQGIDKISMIHLGHGASALERKGIETEKGNMNREIQDSNKYIDLINQEVKKADREIIEINKDIRDGMNPERKSMDELIKDAKQRQKSSEGKESIAADQRSQHREPETSQERSAADLAKENLHWNKEYINLELEISEKYELSGKVNDEVRRIDNASDDIYKKTGNIERWRKDIEKLQERKQGLNIFKGKEKKAIEEQIKSLERPIEQVSQNLERDHGIKPEQAKEKLDELRMQRTEIMKKKPLQSDIDRLKDRQEMAAVKYRVSMIELETRPDREQIMEIMKKIKTSRSFSSHEAQAERKLNQVGKTELEKMLKFVPGNSQAAELIKNKMTAITMDKIKNHYRGPTR